MSKDVKQPVSPSPSLLQAVQQSVQHYYSSKGSSRDLSNSIGDCQPSGDDGSESDPEELREQCRLNNTSKKTEIQKTRYNAPRLSSRKGIVALSQKNSLLAKVAESRSATGKSTDLVDILREELLSRSFRSSRGGTEKKVLFNTIYNSTYAGSPTAYNLTSILQGDQQNTRTSNSIRLHSIKIKIIHWQPVNITGISAGPYQPGEINHTLFADKVPKTPGTAPAVYTSNTTVSPPSDASSLYITSINDTTVYRASYLRNTNTLGMYHIYFRKNHHIKPEVQVDQTQFYNGGWVREYVYDIKCHGRRVQYADSASGNAIINAVYFHVQYDQLSNFAGYATTPFLLTYEVVFDDCVE